MSTTELWRTAMFKTATVYDQIEIFVTTGTINAGTIYVQMYERANVVESHDFGVTSLSNWDTTGLTKAKDSLIVLSSYDLVLSASASISARVSTDDITFDTGASDYLFGFAAANSDDAQLNSVAVAGLDVLTNHGLCAVILGMPLVSRSSIMASSFGVAATNSITTFSAREAKQAEETLRIFPSASASIDDGTAYAVRYEL